MRESDIVLPTERSQSKALEQEGSSQRGRASRCQSFLSSSVARVLALAGLQTTGSLVSGKKTQCPREEELAISMAFLDSGVLRLLSGHQVFLQIVINRMLIS